MLFLCLIEGFTIYATATPSIPSRYLTITSSNSERQGFQQTARRFQDDFVCNQLILLNNHYFILIEFHAGSWSISNIPSIR
jgi:hypothetical protein